MPVDEINSKSLHLIDTNFQSQPSKELQYSLFDHGFISCPEISNLTPLRLRFTGHYPPYCKQVLGVLDNACYVHVTKLPGLKKRRENNSEIRNQWRWRSVFVKSVLVGKCLGINNRSKSIIKVTLTNWQFIKYDLALVCSIRYIVYILSWKVLSTVFCNLACPVISIINESYIP